MFLENEAFLLKEDAFLLEEQAYCIETEVFLPELEVSLFHHFTGTRFLFMRMDCMNVLDFNAILFCQSSSLKGGSSLLPSSSALQPSSMVSSG